MKAIRGPPSVGVSPLTVPIERKTDNVLGPCLCFDIVVRTVIVTVGGRGLLWGDQLRACFCVTRAERRLVFTACGLRDIRLGRVYGCRLFQTELMDSGTLDLVECRTARCLCLSARDFKTFSQQQDRAFLSVSFLALVE